MEEPKTLGDCKPCEIVTLISGIEVEVIRQRQDYPWWVIVRETESGRECEFHKSARLK